MYLFGKKLTHYNLFTCLANFDLRLAALFLWIIFLFVNLSSIDSKVGSNANASFLFEVSLSFLIALRVVL